ncbi:DUF1697 domain-containing protein [Microbacterium sp. P01]|uniref:DUF1697 domain-containing protein n=1 Tax=Microbacterium sp. P01 TaxID=3366261 RepID=UPI003670384B
MTTWVALLRGVNVGGITVRSADLATMLRGLGLAEVKTFLASGNARFETDAAASARSQLKASIERALRDRFRYEAWIILVTKVELEAAIAGFPFDAQDPTRHPYVIFCSEQTVQDEITEAAASADPAVDPVGSGDGVLYWHPVKGTTVDTPFSRILARSRYKATTTNRNLRTLIKIVE